MAWLSRVRTTARQPSISSAKSVIMSQAASAATNALVTWLALSTLAPKEAGRFAVVVAVSFLMTSFLRGSIIYGRGGNCFPKQALFDGARFGVPLSLALSGGIAFWIGVPEAIVAAATFPFLGVHEVVRQALLVRRSWLAFWLDAVWFLVCGTGLLGVRALGYADNPAVLLFVWGSSAGVALCCGLRMFTASSAIRSVDRPNVRGGFESVLQGISVSALVVGAAASISFVASADIRAAFLLFMPLRQAQAVLQPGLIGMFLDRSVSSSKFALYVAWMGIASVVSTALATASILLLPDLVGVNSPDWKLVVAIGGFMVGVSLQMVPIAALRTARRFDLLVRIRVFGLVLTILCVAASSSALRLTFLSAVSSFLVAGIVYTCARRGTNEELLTSANSDRLSVSEVVDRTKVAGRSA